MPLISTLILSKSPGVNVTEFARSLQDLDPAFEVGVFNESQWGRMVWASDFDASVLERILRIISDGSRGSRANPLSTRQAHQLRDAMIFEAHVRSARDIFVTNDLRAFINHGRRERLQAELRTSILTRPEFLEHCRSLRAGRRLTSDRDGSQDV